MIASQSMTTGFGWMIDIGWQARPRPLCMMAARAGPRTWILDCAAHSDPTCTLMTIVFGCIIDWAADSDPTSMTTVFRSPAGHAPRPSLSKSGPSRSSSGRLGYVIYRTLPVAPLWCDLGFVPTVVVIKLLRTSAL